MKIFLPDASRFREARVRTFVMRQFSTKRIRSLSSRFLDISFYPSSLFLGTEYHRASSVRNRLNLYVYT